MLTTTLWVSIIRSLIKRSAGSAGGHGVASTPVKNKSTLLRDYVARFWKVLPIIGVVTMVTTAANSWGDRGQIVVSTTP